MTRIPDGGRLPAGYPENSHASVMVMRHQPGEIENGRRPPLENGVLFLGMNGFLGGKQSSKEDDLSKSVTPEFGRAVGRCVRFRQSLWRQFKRLQKEPAASPACTPISLRSRSLVDA